MAATKDFSPHDPERCGCGEQWAGPGGVPPITAVASAEDLAALVEIADEADRLADMAELALFDREAAQVDLNAAQDALDRCIETERRLLAASDTAAAALVETTRALGLVRTAGGFRTIGQVRNARAGTSS